MTINASLGLAIFLLGCAIGALLTHLQGIVLKQVVLQQIMKQLKDDPQLYRDNLLKNWPE